MNLQERLEARLLLIIASKEDTAKQLEEAKGLLFNLSEQMKFHDVAIEELRSLLTPAEEITIIMEEDKRNI